MEEQEQCQKCGRPRGKSSHKQLCQKCLKSLPQCKACTMVCGVPEWGFFWEEKAALFISKKNHKEIILCGACEKQLKTKGFLRIEGKIEGGGRKIRKDEIELAKK